MNIIGIYPGTFQPPTVGNFRAYTFLKKYTGENTFVTTTDVISLPASPLTFLDKQQIWTRHGVPNDKVVMTKNPDKAVEVTRKFGTDRTVAIFAMSAEDASKAMANKTGYFLKFESLTPGMQPMSVHGYILIIPSNLLLINKGLTDASLRQAFGSKTLPEESKKSFFKQLFGWYDISLFDLIKKKFAEAGTVKERMNESYMTVDECEKAALPVVRRTLKAFVKEILGQMTTPQGQGTQAASVSPLSTEPALTPGEIQKQERDLRAQRDAQLKQKSVELQTAKKERDFLKQKTDQSNRFAIPNLNKDIQKLKGAKI